MEICDICKGKTKDIRVRIELHSLNSVAYEFRGQKKISLCYDHVCKLLKWMDSQWEDKATGISINQFIEMVTDKGGERYGNAVARFLLNHKHKNPQDDSILLLNMTRRDWTGGGIGPKTFEVIEPCLKEISQNLIERRPIDGNDQRA